MTDFKHAHCIAEIHEPMVCYLQLTPEQWYTGRLPTSMGLNHSVEFFAEKEHENSRKDRVELIRQKMVKLGYPEDIPLSLIEIKPSAPEGVKNCRNVYGFLFAGPIDVTSRLKEDSAG